MTLQAAIEKGLKEEAHQITNVLMQEKSRWISSMNT